MGKKIKFPFLFKATETSTTATTSAALSWPWPTCVNNPKTLSFRANTNDIYKTINSAYLDDKSTAEFADTQDSFFSICSSFGHHHEDSFSFASEISNPNNDESAVIGGLRSDRLFFEPGETSSILEEAKTNDSFYKESVAILAIDSRDPFVDFRVSMEEMVEAHGLKDWECLEELLACYLIVNGESNHGYIVGAFVDLVIHLAMASASNDSSNGNCSCSSNTTQYSFTSPLSFSSSTYSSTSPRLSLLETEEGIVIEKNGDSSSSSSSSVYNDASSAGV